jgi:hypothetical protein
MKTSKKSICHNITGMAWTIILAILLSHRVLGAASKILADEETGTF